MTNRSCLLRDEEPGARLGDQVTPMENVTLEGMYAQPVVSEDRNRFKPEKDTLACPRLLSYGWTYRHHTFGKQQT